ncbi:MAG: zinc-ribbon domain-containing protein [Promethearchaeota archaeon]
MVTCQTCGANNEEDAAFCAKCGAALYAKEKSRGTRTDCFGGPGAPEDECFGLPYGGAICGLLLGFFIILWAISYFVPAFQLIGAYTGPILLGIVGVLIIAGALYSINRRRKQEA